MKRTFNPDEKFLTEKFNEFNNTYFEGKLPMAKFGYLHSTRVLGICYENNIIKMTLNRPEMTKHDFEEVLIHEMVHAWQNYMGYWDDGHRRSFVWKAQEINSKSNGYFHIARCANLENGQSDTIIHRDTDYVKILVCRKENDKTIYVGRVVDEKKFERWLGKYYVDIKCYEGSGEGLGIFIKSFKVFHYKTMTEELFNDKVKPYLNNQIPFNNMKRNERMAA